MKSIKAKNNEYDWAIFATSYLQLANLACQELLDNRANKHNKAKVKPFNIPYKPQDLFVAILFNIKHGIEIFIKTLSIFAYGEYEEGHDIHDLFQAVKKKVKVLKINPIKKGSNEIKQTDIDSLYDDLDKMEELINYFYTLDLLKDKIGKHYTINDIQNDIFRYPDNKASVCLDWDAILDSQINDADIRQVQGKLDQIYKLFCKRGYFFAVLSE